MKVAFAAMQRVAAPRVRTPLGWAMGSVGPCRSAARPRRFLAALASPPPSAGDGSSSAASPPSEPWTATSHSGSLQTWLRRDLRIALVHPQIPQNAGSVARTCAATGIPLHLVGPMGFALDSTKLKRAGLDYWNYVCVGEHADADAFLEHVRREAKEEGRLGAPRLVAFSKAGGVHYATDGLYRVDGWTPESAAEAARGGGAAREAEAEVVQRSRGAAREVKVVERGVGAGAASTAASTAGSSAAPLPAPCWLVFGAETSGLPANVIEAAKSSPGGGVARLPIRERYVRSLNLAACVAVGAFEALQQVDGATLEGLDD